MQGFLRGSAGGPRRVSAQSATEPKTDGEAPGLPRIRQENLVLRRSTVWPASIGLLLSRGINRRQANITGYEGHRCSAPSAAAIGRWHILDLALLQLNGIEDGTDTIRAKEYYI